MGKDKFSSKIVERPSDGRGEGGGVGSDHQKEQLGGTRMSRQKVMC